MFNNGDWHHVAIAGDRTGSATFYLNGNSVGTGWIGDKSGSGYSLGRTVIRIGGYGDYLDSIVELIITNQKTL